MQELRLLLWKEIDNASRTRGDCPLARLLLTIACGDYDRTRPLIDGRVQPEGIDLNYIALSPEEIFWRQFQYEEFDVSEISMSSYIIQRARGIERFVAIPVFVSRLFRHGNIFVRTDRGIDKPEDLRGKRVGIAEYQMTATVFVRGFLQHDYDVKPSDIHWLTGGQEEPGRQDRVAISLPPDVRLEPINPGQTLNQMLIDGDIDALIAARAPSSFTTHPHLVRRLFPNYWEVEREYYLKTGIYPIMHAIAVKREIYERNPWVAQSLYKAFQEAKQVSMEALSNTGALATSLPWQIAELERTKQIIGEDIWPYGIEANRTTLQALLDYEFEQRLIPRRLTIEELFASNTLEEYRL